MSNQQTKRLFSNSENLMKWNYREREIDPQEYIKVGKLTPEMKKNNKRVVNEMMLLLKDYLGLLTEQEQQELTEVKKKLQLD